MVAQNENLEYLSRHRPDIAQKAHMVLSELGIHELRILTSDDVKSLTELIQFYNQHEGKDPEIEEIRNWKDQINLGITPMSLARAISRSNSHNPKFRSRSG